jgi:branched-subunit amino acid aminotransferase/4-amino-4-deoxychorismate lyase
MEEPQAYLNGRFVPASRVAISPTDAGFVSGATVAEQLRTFAGKLFRLDDHLARLEQSLEIVGVEPGVTMDNLAGVAQELVARNHRLLASGDDLGLSVFVTPGEYPAYSSSGSPGPIVCMHTYLLPFRLWAEKYEKGQSLVVTDIRQVPVESWPPGLKCRSRMHYYLADRQAAKIEPGARALLLDGDGLVTEASTANVIVSTAADKLVCPPRAKVLAGISLAEVVELAAEAGIETVHHDLTTQDVAAAAEVLLTSTPLCLLPVTRFNGHKIADGNPGPIFRRLLGAWSARVGIDIVAQAGQFAGRS